MLTMSRLDYAPDLLLRPVDVNRIVADVRERLEISAEKKNIEIHLELDQHPSKMLADESELERMLVNLVENALNYTPAGGKVWIRSYTQSDLICVEIRDTGIGIGEKDLPRVFDRFYRADTARSTKISGTGLGLAIVKRIVEMHGGEIEVQSTLGEGTTFRIQFPAVVESAI
jgi:two-component system phosphate regulon sensor histidine kinase PhoR